jgi:hypothetical protein
VEQEKKKTPKAVVVVAVVFVVVVIAATVLWTASPGFVATWKARYCAGRIGEGANNGLLARKMLALGKDAALPAAIDMLTRDDYVARRHGLVIIDKLEATEAVDAILAAMPHEKVARNRAIACTVVEHRFIAQPEHCGKIMAFLADPDETVRTVACGAIQKMSNLDIPGRTAEQWIEWWEKNKEEISKKGGAQKSSTSETDSAQ